MEKVPRLKALLGKWTAFDNVREAPIHSPNVAPKALRVELENNPEQ